jgi:hypothetical protein
LMPPPQVIAEAFEREQGCTEAEWQRWLPGAVRGHALSQPAPGRARVDIDAGALHLSWAVLPPRQIALIRMPRMAVHYRFEAVDADARSRFMQYFDLYMQRGGG